jgi:RNA polymerase sigma-70 factor (ECF subfamily)
MTAIMLTATTSLPLQPIIETLNPVDSDDMLVVRTLDGDTTAFTALVERYKRPVYALAYRLLGNATDAEDAAQETFVRAYTRLTSYQLGSRFGSWLLAITSHWCIDSLRRKRALSLEAASEGRGDLGTPASPEEQPEAVTLHRERQHEVRAWLNQLPAPYRAVIELRYWQDLSYNEISETTGLPVSTVRMRLFRARQLLSVHSGATGHSTALPIS